MVHDMNLYVYIYIYIHSEQLHGMIVFYISYLLYIISYDHIYIYIQCIYIYDIDIYRPICELYIYIFIVTV